MVEEWEATKLGAMSHQLNAKQAAVFFYWLPFYVCTFFFFCLFFLRGLESVFFFFPVNKLLGTFFFFPSEALYMLPLSSVLQEAETRPLHFFFPCELWSKRVFFFSRFLIFLSPIEINGFSVLNIRFPFVDILSPQDVLRTFAFFLFFCFFLLVCSSELSG